MTVAGSKAMWNRAILLIAAAFALAAVEGCADRIGRANDYLPLAVGDKWAGQTQIDLTRTTKVGEKPETTEITHADQTGQSTITRTDTNLVKGAAVFVLETQVKGSVKTNAESGTKTQQVDVKLEKYYEQAADGIQVRGYRVLGDGGAPNLYEWPMVELPTPAKVGSQWLSHLYRLMGDLGIPVQVKAKVTGTATVKVAAGEFKNCLVVEIEPLRKEFGEESGKALITDWKDKEYFAKGVGLVKEEYHYAIQETVPERGESPATLTTINVSTTWELTTYEVK